MKRIRQIISLCKFIFVYPAALIAKLIIKNSWLICEDKFEARDNGYWLYKYIRENHPNRIVHFALSKKSCDYKKIKQLGNVVNYDSLAHWFWYIVSRCNISSQASGRPENGVAKYLEKYGFIKTKFCFLQHGVIINNTKWLYAKRNKIDWFLTSALPEYNYIVNNFGYKKEQVQLLGLPRFDNLHANSVDKDTILIMPTWRTWIKAPECTVMNSETVLPKEDFITTEYFLTWKSFLNNKDLYMLLKKYNKKIIFYPHRNMQRFISMFECENDRIIIASREDYDIQELLKQASILITDYSSVFMDIIYMQKPVLFYQFDERKFRKGQYSEGYFNYKDNEYSYWAEDSSTLIALLEKTIKQTKIEYDITKIFPLYDTNNCKRIYNSILNIFDK